MAKREHGYIALVPVFIPVDKRDTESQIAIMRAVMGAGRGGSLKDITSLSGVRLHVKPGRDIVNRWTSVPALEAAPDEEGAAEEVEEEPAPDLIETMAQSDDAPDLDAAVVAPDATQDEATTTGRRRSRAA